MTPQPPQASPAPPAWPTLIEAQIAAWHEIAPPNPPARRLAAQLIASRDAHDAARPPTDHRGTVSDFAASLATLAPPPRHPASRHPASRHSAPRRTASAEVGLAALRDRLRAGEITARAALEAQFARIDATPGAAGALLWQMRAAARAAADAADRHRAANQPLPPLHGVAMAHKDIFAIAGHPQTAGSAFWRNHVADHTSSVIARLLAAGSLVFAGLHMADFAQNPTGLNAHWPDCLNPWDAARIPGGSSSGSGVAVALGLTPAALGTDTGGSIRLPAACCGITGLKPSWGRVSRAGVVPLCESLDCIGPLARTARDCAILLDVIAGPDAADPTATSLPPTGYEAALGQPVDHLTLATAPHLWDPGTPPDILDAVDAALAVFATLGVGHRAVTPPHWDAIVTYGATIGRAEAAALHANWMREDPSRFVPHVAARLYPGYAVPATHYIEAVRNRAPLLHAFCDAVFGAADVLALPTLPGRVPTRAETDMDTARSGTDSAFFATGNHVRPFNYLGLPALTLPIGFDANALPIGLQLVGRPFAEATLLTLADAYQDATGLPPLVAP